MASLSYFAVGSNRLDAAKAFYDELMAFIGWEKLFDHPSGGRLYSAPGKGLFGVLGPINGEPATVSNGFTGGFAFDSGEEVAAFHAKALELGATCEGPPGERAPGIHFGYFRDLDGHKLCGYKFGSFQTFASSRRSAGATAQRSGAAGKTGPAMELKGTSSDQLADVLATGESDARTVFVSFSAREPAGRDAEYIEWHTLDHRPEQYRLAGLRNALRCVSTPECRALRAASAEPFDAVDHVMTYQFTDAGSLGAFSALGAALDAGGRMSLRLPSVRYFVGELAGRLASPTALIGADVVPWRPHAGVYLLLESGHATPEDLLQVPGVIGVWWYHGRPSPPPFSVDSTGLQISYCYLDEVAAATGAINDMVRRRWSTPGLTGLLAAPFYATVPFEWDRHLP